MVYSRAFDSLPAPIRARLYQGIFEALKAAGREDVREILRRTKPERP
jgi:hypothetical protein